MARLQRKATTRPDEARDVPRGRLEMFELGDTMVGRSIFEPGWRWSESVKPLAGTEDCEFHHQGYTLSGRAHVRMRDGAEIELGPGEFFEIPPHHEAWVVGDEPWVSLDWGGATSYALDVSGSGRRILTNVLFTDVVDSTVRARHVGDSRWRDLLEQHNLIIRRELDRYGGREVNTTGDGFLALFESAERAVRAAQAMIQGVSGADLQIRAAIHSGEVELQGNDVRGLAVHIAARVLGLARPGEALVSWTTYDLLSGSALSFEDRGLHELKGLPDRRQVYAVLPTQALASRRSGRHCWRRKVDARRKAMAGIEQKNVGEPDEAVDYGEQGRAAKVSVGIGGFGLGSESTIWLSTLRPGWSWERNIKPNVPFESCPLHHREYVIAGRIRYVMDDGTSVEATPGDHLLIDPGHHAEVMGDEDCLLVDW